MSCRTTGNKNNTVHISKLILMALQTTKLSGGSVVTESTSEGIS